MACDEYTYTCTKRTKSNYLMKILVTTWDPHFDHCYLKKFSEAISNAIICSQNKDLNASYQSIASYLYLVNIDPYSSI